MCTGTTLRVDTYRQGKTPEDAPIHTENTLGNTSCILKKLYCRGKQQQEPHQERSFQVHNSVQGFQKGLVLHSIKKLQPGSRRIKTDDVTEAIHLAA